jgi:hypothetical protein
MAAPAARSVLAMTSHGHIGCLWKGQEPVMQAPRPAIAARLQSLRLQARDDAGRDSQRVRAWSPSGGESAREVDDWVFVAKQVLTRDELAAPSEKSSRWPPAGS